MEWTRKQIKRISGKMTSRKKCEPFNSTTDVTFVEILKIGGYYCFDFCRALVS